MKKTYECLYNHDMGSIPQCLTVSSRSPASKSSSSSAM